MSELTSVSMEDARDAEDRRLLEEGAFERLVESYYGVMVDRCSARLPAADVYDVAADAALRLLSELKRGKRYTAPFRVVVHQVIGWKIKEHYMGKAGHHAELPGDLVADDPFEDVEGALDFELLVAGATELEREVLTLRWRDGVEIEEIAQQLGKTRNAVDQILHRGVARLRERLAA